MTQDDSATHLAARRFQETVEVMSPEFVRAFRGLSVAADRLAQQGREAVAAYETYLRRVSEENPSPPPSSGSAGPSSPSPRS